jgi:hypothetical protein
MTLAVVHRTDNYSSNANANVFIKAGNLWNLGEFPAEYEDNGKFDGAPDTWISGLGKAQPGNLMMGNPQLGTPEYLQGWSPDIDFLDCAKVYKMQDQTCVPVGCYDKGADH